MCQVAEAAAGPFVLRDPLGEAFAQAAGFGFDAVELFLPAADFVAAGEVRDLATAHRLGIAAVGTGAGMLRHGLSLTDPSAARRAEALDFILRMIDFGGQLEAPAILGSMQGRWGGEVGRAEALDWLAEALAQAGVAAAAHGVAFIYEPLNRYETNLLNRLSEAAQFIESRGLANVVLLADLFHMNIEEQNLADSIRGAGRHVGHVHYADSNRQAMGLGHTDPAPVIAALREISYSGFLSAEIFPLPDPAAAARQTLTSIHSLTACKPDC